MMHGNTKIKNRLVHIIIFHNLNTSVKLAQFFWPIILDSPTFKYIFSEACFGLDIKPRNSTIGNSCGFHPRSTHPCLFRNIDYRHCGLSGLLGFFMFLFKLPSYLSSSDGHNVDRGSQFNAEPLSRLDASGKATDLSWRLYLFRFQQ